MVSFIKDLGMRFPNKTSKRKVRYGLYLCPLCGNEFEGITGSITKKQTKSCGCIKIKKKLLKYQISKNDLTVEELKKNLRYNKDVGTFFRISGKQISMKTNNKGYYRIMVAGTHYLAHRLAWFYEYGYFPDTIDHINHTKTDNRIENLRDVSIQENQKNLSIGCNNKTGETGVHFSKDRNKYVAKIQIKNKTIHLGYFDKKDDAIIARRIANEKYTFHLNHGK